ncbi:pyridoxal-dependent decarboxylase domain protein [Moniliophthora roreri MCA 2997]|uniref:Pyridoxal-dependent decarboxylase domain protein n=1 Tax=Moniliophthora roreri (strain MCA 2997) TaxID=1381753 RepID=V2WG60_MONRO|nr:pyridoxal-dependent decarboxylase domain protein [Moniliophthora roreri MCA 2997]
MPQLPNYDEDLHHAVSAWFLGPRAENFGYLTNVLNIVLMEQGKARNSYYPEDPPFIPHEVQVSSAFQTQMKKLTYGVTHLAEKLSRHHVPFWNPRYNGHMTNDTTLPGIAGYLTAMLFNPNNVAAEASPLTTQIEYLVGQELCEMVDYNVIENGQPRAWGHITCDGSVANLESIWAARNLKFYPLSLVLAMDKGEPLDFIADTFTVPTCTGTVKLLRDFTTWELLNIAPSDVLEIPDRLYSQYSFSPQFLEETLDPFIIQSASKDASIYAKKFGLEKINNIAYITSATKHYSWPKGAAVTGIGKNNLISITVDDGARMKPQALRDELDKCIKEERAVYAVVAIIGSTEHGACDPLPEIVRIRDEYRKKGLSFVLHADGAWGTYFSTTLRDVPTGGRERKQSFVPSVALKKPTQDALKELKSCDSITVDPHKSGYIQYPAGGLLYRDERMRFLVTWSSPVVNRTGEESMGVYGIEGSKPGAAPVATFLSHAVIGLNARGYGALLGEAVFGCAIMYAYLVTMSTKDTDFIVTPLNLLPAELEGGDVEGQKQFIRNRILRIPNEKLVHDQEAMQLIQDMGSDLSINAFAVNFKIDGKPNEDVISANNLNQRIFERLSIVSPEGSMNDKPLFLTSTQFPYQDYGDCLKTYKRRLGLATDTKQDLYSLINVVMSPFPTEMEFTGRIADDLRTVIEEEVETSRTWNTISPASHGFVMQGTDKLYLVYLPMFNMANHRYQLIITGDLPDAEMAQYVAARELDPKQLFTLRNAERDTLENLLEKGKFNVDIDRGLPPNSSRLLSNVPLTNVQIVVKRQIDSKHLADDYPRLTMPFFMYGSGTQYHIDHVLLASPNIQLNSDQVRYARSAPLSGEPYVYAHLQNLPEKAMQPFPDNSVIEKNPNFFFKPGARFRAKITKDLEGQIELDDCDIYLGDVAFVDTTNLNMFPMPKGQDKGLRQILHGWTDVVKHIREGMK